MRMKQSEMLLDAKSQNKTVHPITCDKNSHFAILPPPGPQPAKLAVVTACLQNWSYFMF